MSEQFTYDVFLSHSSKDKDTVRVIAERLRKDGVHVWFDEWEIKPGDHIPVKIEEGLEYSRVLVLCMSTDAFNSDWASLEAGTFRFRDPLNKERRFIPLRLDNCPIKNSLAQFLYIDWFAGDSNHVYTQLIDACKPLIKLPSKVVPRGQELSDDKFVQLLSPVQLSSMAFAFSSDGKRVLTGGNASNRDTSPQEIFNAVLLWDLDTGHCIHTLKGHVGRVENIVWSADQRIAITASHDKTARIWDIAANCCLKVLEGHTDVVNGVTLSSDENFVFTSSFDKTVRQWEIQTGKCLRIFEGHQDRVRNTSCSADNRFILSCSDDNTIRLWDVASGLCLRVFEDHNYWVMSVSWSPDQRYALSGSCDNTMRLWHIDSGRCLRIFEGHTSNVEYIVWSIDQRFAISASPDMTVRLWNIETGFCLGEFFGHTAMIRGLEWNKDNGYAFSGDMNGGIFIWNLLKVSSQIVAQQSKLSNVKFIADQNQVQYTNAKVLLVGESSAGKTGLSKTLSGEKWQPSDSTVGAWATQLKLPVDTGDGIEREIWLWDFGGQADQRLIHQLYMDEAALAVLVFDGQRDNLIETLSQWDRELTRASKKPFTKLLVAGRVDAGGLRVGKVQVEAFVKERGYTNYRLSEIKFPKIQF